MKVRWILALGLAFSIVAASPAQTDAERVRQATEITRKLQRLDLLNQILPVLMTRDQIRRILPAIEQARQNARDLERAEFERMKVIVPRLDAALEAAEKRGTIPPTEFLDEVSKMLRQLATARTLMMALNADKVLEAMERHLNEGQRRAAANALDPRMFNPDADVSKLTEQQKLKAWIKHVLLNENAYQILVDLSR